MATPRRASEAPLPPPKRPRTTDDQVQQQTIDLTESPPPSPPRIETRSETSEAAIASAAGTTVEPLGFRLTTLKDAPASHSAFAVGLSDLLDGDFSQCLLTNYMYDMAWLFGACPRLHDVSVVLVHGERDRAAMAAECRGFPNVTLVAPRLPIPYGTHHTKMMVIVYATHVRVVVCTANFIAIDWNNKTQGVWTQDFPLAQAAASSTSSSSLAPPSSSSVVDFERDLIDYLSTLGTAVVDFCAQLRRFDFSAAEVALIPSVPGVHTGKDMDKYGHLRVRKLLQHLKAPASDHPLICQFSSMGSLDEKWLFGEFAPSLMPGSFAQLASGTALPIKAFHIIWPAVEDIRNSIEGWNGGRAVPCPLKNMKPFLHKYLRKWTPPDALHRQNAMPHIKTYARFNPTQSGLLDYAILTSSNLSKAAWGALQKNKTQFMIRSYELGVLFLPRPTASSSPPQLTVVGSQAASDESTPRLLLPLPYGFPLKTYNPKQDEPWVWDLVRESPDVFGNCYIPR